MPMGLECSFKTIASTKWLNMSHHIENNDMKIWQIYGSLLYIYVLFDF